MVFDTHFGRGTRQIRGYVAFALLVLIIAGGAVLSASAQRSNPSRIPSYKAVPDWLKLPAGLTEIGNMHGDIAVSSRGEVYVSVRGGPKTGLQVYSPDGAFLRNVPGAPIDLHGFIIHQEGQGEFIYAVRLSGGPSAADQSRDQLPEQAVIKMTLDGKIVQAIPASAIPDQFKDKGPEGQPMMRLTSVTVAPNGDMYVADGYASSYIHRFDRTGKYIKSFGGKDAPYGFNTLHKLAIDTRFSPPRLIACDRANGRVVHLSMDGDLMDVVATDMNLPAAVAIYGDYAAIAELRPGSAASKTLTGKVTQISILDKSGKTVAVMGTNDRPDEIGVNTTQPAKWRPAS
jgi:hypothetical protein